MGYPNSWMVYNEQSHPEVDDDWGYPYDSGHLQECWLLSSKISSIWVNYHISRTWIKPKLGSFPLFTNLPVRENSVVVIVYPQIYIYIYVYIQYIYYIYIYICIIYIYICIIYIYVLYIYIYVLYIYIHIIYHIMYK